MPVARACGVGLSAVQLTGRPWAARARAVVGPMAANCRGERGSVHLQRRGRGVQDSLEMPFVRTPLGV